MACLPLIERELRVAVRKQRPGRSRLKVAALAAGGSVIFLLLGSLFRSRSLGVQLEQLLCIAAIYCIARTPLIAAGVLAEERRNQTLGLLFLSGLGAGEVFVSKFLSSGLVAFSNLLAIFPMLALPFLLGGISFNVFVAIICALPVLMLFALALSLFASALAREDGIAVVLANTVGLLLCVLTPAIYTAQTHFAPGTTPSLWWVRLSPAYGPMLLWKAFGLGFRSGDRAEFWANLGVTLGWSLLLLSAAALALNRLWQRQQSVELASGWAERWQRFLHGGRDMRWRLARAWIDINPFVWLAGRDRQPVMLGWLIVCSLVLVWLLSWALWPAHWPSVQNAFVTATLLNSILAWLTRHTAARNIGEPRRDGHYELLLTTPLNPSDIVWGTLEALDRGFKSLARFILLLDFLLLLGALFTRSWSNSALVVYLCVCIFLLGWAWTLGRWHARVLTVMWASLNCGRPAHAVWRTSGFNAWSWVWIMFNLRHLGRGFQRFPTGSLTELIVVLLIIFILALIWLWRLMISRSISARKVRWDPQTRTWVRSHSGITARADEIEARLVTQFREIVREPLPDPTDPRFKKWNVQERFPPG